MATINNEDYFQINTDILASFPKHRLPLNLYIFRDDIAVLEPFYRKGNRLTDEQIEKLVALCEAGSVFVSHLDQEVYKQHIVKQLDLVLLDPHFSDGEVAEICILAIAKRYLNFYNQSVPEVYNALYRDVMVLTEYLWADKYRIMPFVRRLFRKAKPERHAVNTMIVGTWLWMQQFKEYTRKDLDRLVLALVLHDIGMCKTPQFILAKQGRLKPEEKEKVIQHTYHSLKLVQKCELTYDEVIHACFEHHERLDGSGYPQRYKGTQISTIGKITALADSFSAMICERCYAKAKTPEQAGRELHSDSRYDTLYSTPLATAFVQGGPMSNMIDMDSKADTEVR
ncbi:MAG: HD domain-containing protein [Desulfovibrionaceae bacterium]|nr:HD domain-containing protein [Desulfovibrionaceae bacterium]